MIKERKLTWTGKLFLVLSGFFLLVVTTLILKWCISNSASSNVSDKVVAEVLVALAPDDPWVHLAFARILEKSNEQDSHRKAIAHYIRALELSPFDYRLWLEAGIAIERYEDPESAEKFLRKAHELAPNYAYVNWVFGNNLIRQGKKNEALERMRKAIENDEKIAGPALAVIYDIFGADLDKVLQMASSSYAKASLSLVLARRKLFEQAFRVWDELTLAEKRDSFRQVSEDLLRLFISEKKFHLAFELLKQVNDDGIDFEKIKNSSFEDQVSQGKENLFDWKISEGLFPQIGINREYKQSGEQSLIMVFDGSTYEKPRSVEQLITVFPDEEYTLSFFFRSTLKDAIRWEVLDANNGRLLGYTGYLPAVSDWKPVEIKFSTSKQTEAVILRLAYQSCIYYKTCSALGKIWFDDFELRK